jgi:Sugar (and other) transporter
MASVHSSTTTLSHSDSASNLQVPAQDVEGQKASPASEKVPHWRLVWSQSLVTDAVLNHPYRGLGTLEKPYLVEFIPNDPRNPMAFSTPKKWFITLSVAVAFVSTAYTEAVRQVIEEFRCSQIIGTLGVSLFVLGFALGPLLWGPLSELYGQQFLFIGTYAVLTAFNAAAAGAPNIQSLIVMRFLAGTFGASPLTNAGGVS